MRKKKHYNVLDLVSIGETLWDGSFRECTILNGVSWGVRIDYDCANSQQGLRFYIIILIIGVRLTTPLFCIIWECVLFNVKHFWF